MSSQIAEVGTARCLRSLKVPVIPVRYLLGELEMEWCYSGCACFLNLRQKFSPYNRTTLIFWMVNHGFSCHILEWRKELSSNVLRSSDKQPPIFISHAQYHRLGEESIWGHIRVTQIDFRLKNWNIIDGDFDLITPPLSVDPEVSFLPNTEKVSNLGNIVMCYLMKNGMSLFT